MTLFELFIPKGALSEAQRRRLSERLVTEVISGAGAPEPVIARGRALTQVVVHEPELWGVGGRSVEPDEPPRFVVRVSVPGGHLNDGMRAELVARVTRAIAGIDANRDRHYQEPTTWVYIVEIPDGHVGAFGQVVSTGDVLKLAVTGERPGTDGASDDASASDASAPDTVVDPICGMTVALIEDAIIVEHDGATYGFCSAVCRDLFAAQQGLAVAS